MSNEGAVSPDGMATTVPVGHQTHTASDTGVDNDSPLDQLLAGSDLATHEVAPTIGRFSILHKLGQGAMGVVYLGYDARLDRRAAVKLLRASGAGELGRERMLREAQALARLSHPNVIPIYESGEHGPYAYLVMEYVAGDTLRNWIRAAPRTPLEILKVFIAAGRGLEAAHEQGLTHRDFKPDNVMVGDDGRTRVMDFGLVRAVDDARFENEPKAVSVRQVSDVDLTRTGVRVGTPAYMAPEQYRGGRIGPLADQFSFCVALWEALYGTRPFTGRTLAELETNIVEHRITAHAEEGQVPARIRRALERGLASAQGDRWPSMGALLGVLEDELRAPRRRFLMLGAVMIIAALISVAGFAWQKTAVLRENGANKRSVLAERQALESLRLLDDGNSVDALALAIEAAAGLTDQSGSVPATLPEEVSRALYEASTADLSWSAVATFPDYPGAVSFSPDGIHLALGTLQDAVEIHDLEEGAVSAKFTVSDCDARAVNFFADGSRLLIDCARNAGARLCDASGALLETFEPQALATVSAEGSVVAIRDHHDVRLIGSSGATVATLRGHAREPTLLAFSVDGLRLVTAGPKTVRVWDTTSGEALAVLAQPGVVAVAWLADDRLATVARDQRVRIWSTESGEQLNELVAGPGWHPHFELDDFRGFAVSGDDSRIALCIDRRFWLWDAATGVLLKQLDDETVHLHSEAGLIDINLGESLSFSPDGSRVVVRRHDRSILLLDANSGETIRASKFTWSYSFSPDGKLLAVGDDSGVEIWDSNTGALMRSLRRRTAPISWTYPVTTFSPDGRFLAVRGAESIHVSVFDARVAPSSMATVRDLSPADVLAVAPEGGLLATADAGLVTIWNVGSGKPLATSYGHSGGLRLAEFSRDGRVLGTVDGDQILRVWNTSSNRLVGGPFKLDHTVSSIAVSNNGTLVALVSSIGALREGTRVLVRDVRSFASVVDLPGQGRWIQDTAFSPDNRLLATVDHSLLRIWALPAGELSAGELVAESEHGGSTISFSPDGTRLATADHLLDAATGALVMKLEYPGFSKFFASEFSPDGAVLAAGGRLWDGTTGAYLGYLEGHAKPIHAMGFLDRGDRIVTVSRDVTIVRDVESPIATGCKRLRPYAVDTGREPQKFDCESISIPAPSPARNLELVARRP